MARDNGPPGVRCTSCTTSDNNGDHVDGVVCSEWGPLLPNSHAPHAPSLATRPPVPVILCFVLNILLETGLYLITIALNQILEENICQSITPDVRGADDPRCKGSIVQSELSLIRGWQVTFDIVPGLLTAVPYGLLADRHDKEFVLGLSVLGGALASSFSVLVCSLPFVFPPRTVWLASAFGFVGGGAPVFNALTLSITSNAVSEQQRSIVFFYMTATVLGSQLIASPLVYLLIEINKWLPIYCGLGCMWLATSLVFSVPRVPQYQATRKATQLEHCPLPVRAVTVTVRETVIGIGQAAMWFAHNNTVVVMLLLTFLVTSLGRLAQEVLLQFVTKRYGWSWSEAGLLLTLQAFCTLTLLTVILPTASKIRLGSTSSEIQGRNLWLVRISVLMSTLGAFTIGFSKTVTLMCVGLSLFSLGNGYPPLVRSLLASIVDRHHANTMYTTMSVFETMGSVMAGPILAASFRFGLELGGAWIGLPFIIAGCLFGSALLVVTSINLSKLRASRSRLEMGES